MFFFLFARRLKSDQFWSQSCPNMVYYLGGLNTVSPLTWYLQSFFTTKGGVRPWVVHQAKAERRRSSLLSPQPPLTLPPSPPASPDHQQWKFVGIHPPIKTREVQFLANLVTHAMTKSGLYGNISECKRNAITLHQYHLEVNEYSKLCLALYRVSGDVN